MDKYFRGWAQDKQGSVFKIIALDGEGDYVILKHNSGETTTWMERLSADWWNHELDYFFKNYPELRIAVVTKRAFTFMPDCKLIRAMYGE